LSSSVGLGLGLYVAYNQLQLLGTLLECTIQNENSCCFSFSLQLEALKNDSNKNIITDTTPIKEKVNEDFVSILESPVAFKHIKIDEQNKTRFKTVKMSLDLNTKKKYRILVVDDSPICRKVLSKILKLNDFDCDEACNGKVKNLYFINFIFYLIM
jgi:PleD family two-component response regulator